MSSKTLTQFVKDNSKFLRLSDGESFTGSYVGYKISANSYDPEKEIVVYKLKFEDGKEVFWQTASCAVAKLFSKFKGGEKVVITRHGDGTQTKYEIKSPEVMISKDELEPDEEVPF
jgi:hypothetical protein